MELRARAVSAGAGELKVSNLSFAYGERLTLSGVSIAIPEGQFACVLGPSGCGKSTLLRLIGGLEKPQEGSLDWNGKALEGPSPERAMVFQDYSLFPWMTVRENLRLAISKASRSLTKKDALNLASEYLAMVGLESSEGRYPYELSGGMRQRGAIARALAVQPKALLMDEPFGALDPVNRAKLQDLLLGIWEKSARSLTVVFVTHDVEEAAYLADRIIMLGAGKLVDDIDVKFGRPRVRSKLFESADFKSVCGEVESSFRREMIRSIEEGDLVKGKGDGI